jgi:hypothetical protein
MTRTRLLTGIVLAVSTAGFHLLSSSHALGSPDPLAGAKTLLFLISGIGAIWLIDRLERRGRE